jgi:hypothetical protein
MRQAIVDTVGDKKIVILNDDVNACAIARRSAQASFAQQQAVVRHLLACRRAAPLFISLSFLAAALVSQARASSEARHAHWHVFAKRVARLVDHLFSRIDRLQAPGFDPKWKSIDLGATVPGLARFPAAQVWLDSHSHAAQASQ